VVAEAKPKRTRKPITDPRSWSALDDEGSRLLASITKQAARACAAGPGTCPEGQLSIWQGLEKKDLDAWNERGDLLFLPVARGGKLIADLYVTQPITNGEGYIQGYFSPREATDLARSMNG
jgi:hypothetical protein